MRLLDYRLGLKFGYDCLDYTESATSLSLFECVVNFSFKHKI